MKILFDFNNLAMRTMHLHQIDITSDDPSWDLWMYLMFDNICNFIITEAPTYEPPIEVILACDTAEKSWRHDVYAPYKADRKKDQEIDWEEVWSQLKQFQANISTYLPWKVLAVPGAEADDVIAVLAELNSEEQVIIHSGDHDYVQLVNNSTIDVYNPHKDDFIHFPIELRIAGTKVELESVEEFKAISILTGQGGKDNVYNVKTPTNWQPQPGKRKPPFGVKSAQKALKNDNFIHYLRDQGLHENYQRNKQLIDFAEIPGYIRDKIVSNYNSYGTVTCDFVSFLHEYGWPSYADKIEDLQNIFSEISGDVEVPLTFEVEAEAETEAEDFII